MNFIKTFLSLLLVSHILNQQSGAQTIKLVQEAEQAMLRSSRYMIENVSTNGGYVWFYLPDLSRRWGEMEAYNTMVWLQGPGTVGMGNIFLDAYHATGNEYYYQAASKAASAIVWGQSHEGGWNYIVDFAGDRSLKLWYNTIGKNGWRLEEFQHYYGNSTFDDDVTTNAARFLLRIYLVKLDPVWKPSLDKAINFVLESQYPLGGWPQRYPLKYDFNKEGHPDYTSYYTFNDGVVWENVNFLIQCYYTLGQERLPDPIRRGMNFYLLSQDSSGAWGQQLNMDIEASAARTYEPKALLPSTTYENAMLLLKFYQYTGDKRFLAGVPDAIEWLKKTCLPENMTNGGKYSHSTFVEMGTNRPVFVHRKGSNVKYGKYYYDYNDDKLLIHYGGKTRIPVERLIEEYERLKSLSPVEVIINSPLKVEMYQSGGTPQQFYNSDGNINLRKPDEKQIKEIIQTLDNEGRWLVKHAVISNPYAGDGQKQELTDDYASTNVGDETDTSGFQDASDQDYISTSAYIRNMSLLINYIQSHKPL